MSGQATNDVVQWARLKDIAVVICNIQWPDTSLMILERAPSIHSADLDPQIGLCLKHYGPGTAFAHWERGRIFCTDFEIRWQKQDDIFQTVYVGTYMELPDFQIARELDLGRMEQRRNSYYLWGRRVVQNELATVGTQPEAGNEVFVELRIPRLLRYPVSPQANRVKLEICEYVNSAGKLVYHRYQRLIEE